MQKHFISSQHFVVFLWGTSNMFARTELLGRFTAEGVHL